LISDFFYTISKIIKSRIFIVSLFIIGLFAVLLYRVFDLQIINENYYMSTYIQKTEKTIYKSGTRGKILDKSGKVLAYDALSYAVTIEDKIDSSDTKNSQLNHIVSQTIDIIEKYGDDGFIKIENDVNCTINAEHAVIATGGSAVYGETAMEHFKDIGTVIYLEVDEIELEERVGSLKERGVVSNGKTTIDEIFEDRKNLYRKYADITLNLNGKSIRESVDDIYDNLINKDSNY